METRGLDPRVGSLLELEPRFGGAFFRPRTGLQPRHISDTREPFASLDGGRSQPPGPIVTGRSGKCC
jgi:hypothetical protein